MGQDADDVVCDPGMITGIDQNGNIDESNTDTCYPTLDAANVVACNNPVTNEAEMHIRISNEFYSSFGAISGDYQQNEVDGTYWKSVKLSRDNMRLSANGEGKFSSYYCPH